MGKEILQKYTIFEVKRQLAEMEKQYGKEQVVEILGEDRSVEIRERLAMMCSGRLTIEPREGDGTRVTVFVPAKKKE